MKSLLKRRARIAHVRHVQHLQAAGIAAQATARVESLESTAERLSALGRALSADLGGSSGATLQQRGELAMRLDAARHGLADTIVGARAQAEHASALRLQARIAQESADKLDERARAAYARVLARKPMAAGTRRTLAEEPA